MTCGYLDWTGRWLQMEASKKLMIKMMKKKEGAVCSIDQVTIRRHATFFFFFFFFFFFLSSLLFSFPSPSFLSQTSIEFPLTDCLSFHSLSVSQWYACPAMLAMVEDTSIHSSIHPSIHLSIHPFHSIHFSIPHITSIHLS